VNTGGVLSAVHETVLVAVAELPQPSEAMNVLVCDREQLLDCTVPSVNVIIGVLQSAVAVAEPRAALISAAEGLQPSVTEEGVTIIVGGLGALNQVTVLDTVALLPQASMAVNVLVCEEEQVVVDTAPSVNDIVGVAHPSVAVAEPSAAVISEEAGLQPSGTLVYEPVNTGGTWSLIQLTVLVIVAVFPQASTAVNVLTCDRKHPLLEIAPSLDVIVVAPHPSVAVAEPSEVLISAGLQPSVTSV
jgi:hypothetical protein